MGNGKLVSIHEAAEIVRDGDLVGIGGMTLYRRPMAMVRELARRGAVRLELLSFMGSVDADFLIGAGCVATMRSSYLGMEFLGSAPNYRRFAEQGRGEVVEETELTVTAGLRAALMEVPFLPVKGIRHTGILDVRKDLKQVECPYTGVSLVAVPAIEPDVAVIHVAKSDSEGNATFQGQLCVDRELAKAAKKVILTTEKIADIEEVAREPGGMQILGFMVDAVVLTPYGAHPTSCYPYYTYDLPHIMEYVAVASSESGFMTYLNKYIRGPEGPDEYLETAGGKSMLSRIKL